MNISQVWIRRPVMTALLMFGLLFFGLISCRRLPINNLQAASVLRASVPGIRAGASLSFRLHRRPFLLTILS